MEYFIHLAILVGLYTILSLSLNLVVGYTGLLSVTHAAFYGIGAYATAILTTRYDMNFFLSVIIGMVIAALVSLVIGFILSRFRGDYYALGSFGLNIIIFSIFLNWQELTQGPLGIPGIGRPNLLGLTFSDNLLFLLLVVSIVGFVYWLCRYLVTSNFGRTLKAIREDEEAIKVFGYSTPAYKLVVFVIAAMIAAIAGSLFAAYISYIDPSSFTLNESILILAMIILGGLGSLKGSLAGAAILILLPEALRFVGFPTDVAAQLRQLTYGVILILAMHYRPNGLFGEYRL